MTTGRNAAAPDLKRWAADQLGLEPEAPPAEAGAALLRRLPAVGFVPPPAWQEALHLLRDGTPPGGLALLGVEDRLRREVDDFAVEFFTLPVAERRQCWQGLAARCAFSPPLTARLRALEPGLRADAGKPIDGNPRLVRLAGQVRELFVLGPAARAVQRQALLRDLDGDLAEWVAVAGELRTRHGAVADLEPELIAQILGAWQTRQEQAERALRAEVEEFAAAFFTVPVGERRQRWQELSSRCAGKPALVARLGALEPGLALTPGLVDDGHPLVQRLIQQIGRLLVLGPQERARERENVLAGLESQLTQWGTAVRQLRKRHPALAALEPELVRELVAWRRRRKVLARRRRQQAQPQSNDTPFQGSLAVVLALVTGLILALVRGATAPRRPTTPTPSFTLPTMPKIDWRDHGRLWQEHLDEAQRQRLLEEAIRKLQGREHPVLPFPPPAPPPPEAPPGRSDTESRK
jgi:hypothetical protein